MVQLTPPQQVSRLSPFDGPGHSQYLMVVPAPCHSIVVDLNPTMEHPMPKPKQSKSVQRKPNDLSRSLTALDPDLQIASSDQP